MTSVADILDEKGHDVLQVDASASVLEAVRGMVEANVGSLLVSEGGQIAGIVTERDCLRHAARGAGDDATTPVRELMSTPLVYVTPDTGIEECMAVMTERRIRHVPVLPEDGELEGLVSIGDLVKVQSRRQSAEIKLLTEYISAS